MYLLNLWKDERGMGVVEVAIIIVIIIAIALIFRTQIESLLTTIFQKINLGIDSL